MVNCSMTISDNPWLYDIVAYGKTRLREQMRRGNFMINGDTRGDSLKHCNESKNSNSTHTIL